MGTTIALIIGVVILWFWLGRDKYKDYTKSNNTKGFYNTKPDRNKRQQVRNETLIKKDEVNITLETILAYGTFKSKIEQAFENNIHETLNDTKDNDPLIIGLALQIAIANTSKELKDADFRNFSNATNINKEELNTIIDEVTTSLLNKYFKS